MRKTFRLIVCCLVAVLALTACSTTAQDGGYRLNINGKWVSFDPAGGIIPDSELERAKAECENEEIILPVPERKGYIFTGWYEALPEAEVKTSEDVDSEVEEVKVEVNTIFSLKKEEVVESKLYTAQWQAIEYSITYFEGGLIVQDLYVPVEEPIEEVVEAPVEVPEVVVEEKTEDPTNPEYYNITQNVNLLPLSREGFTFLGWVEKPEGEIDLSTITADMVLGVTELNYSIEVGTTGDKEFAAVWSRNVYTVSYSLDGGTLEGENPNQFVYGLDGFDLIAPTKTFYNFEGWKDINTGVIYTTRFDDTSITRNVRLIAVWTPVEYTISYDLDGGEFEGEYPTSYNYTSETITLPTPVKKAYVFKGWTDDNGVTSETVTIPKNSFGDRTFTANWSIIIYTIDYANAEDYGPRIEVPVVVDDYEYPTRYTIEDIVNIRNLNRPGYDFMGWVLEDEEYTEAKTDLVLQKGSYGDRVYVPLFKLHDYNLVLNMENAEVDAPRTFTIEDENFTVGEPTRANYIFEGWLCEDGSIKNEVLVECANAQDVVLEALWTPIEYTISYDLAGGEYTVGSADNVTNYNSDVEPFKLINPVKDTYEFAGWIIKGMESKTWPVVNYVFDTSVGGDVTLVATWKAKEYKISYNLGGGSFEYADSNPNSFTNFMDDIVLESPIRDGYTFLGWVEVGKEGNRPVVDYVIKASELRSNVSLRAMWKATSYSINYNLNGGYFLRGASLNATSYTLRDSSFVLTNPVRDGYEFLGWVRTAYASTDNPSLALRVDTSKGGDLSYDALWKANSYTITYNLDGGSYLYGNTNPTTYTAESSFTLANPHKDGCTFVGWIVSGDPLESVNNTVTVHYGTTGDLVFYAVYEQSLVGVGEVTKLQTEIVELGKNDIPRPDWVIKVPEDSKYHYEKAYASGSDFVTNVDNASTKCRQNIAAYLDTKFSNKTSNNSVDVTKITELNTSVRLSEMVEYWEDVNGGVWVLMRISK